MPISPFSTQHHCRPLHVRLAQGILPTGMQHVFVNGVQVLHQGEHTGALPGGVVGAVRWKGKRGPGKLNRRFNLGWATSVGK